MKKRKYEFTEKKYFAAANGYNGFRSYFGSVFDSKSYESIFVLKGGPGTGKSGLMKKIARFSHEDGFDCETIYCSSDPNSLDGVIIKNHDGQKCAVLDGTAPHERDAVIPGIIDTIVNLGDFWDQSMLRSRREDILTLNKIKSQFYKKAYSYLRIISEIDKKIKAEINSSLNEEAVRDIVSKIVSSFPKRTSKVPEIRLVSSLGKEGVVVLDTLESISRHSTCIKGEFGEECVILSKIKDEVMRKDCGDIIFPSNYSDEDTDAIYFAENESVISTSALLNENTAKEIIDAGEFLTHTFDREKMSEMKKMKQNLLEYAKESFAAAGEKHSQLEEIYTPTMDFEKVNKATEKIYQQIKDTLSGKS